MQILERQNKQQRNKNAEENPEESETEGTGGLFDDWMKTALVNNSVRYKTATTECLTKTFVLNFLTEDYSRPGKQVPVKGEIPSPRSC